MPNRTLDFEALAEREAHYRHTIENSPLVKWSATPDGKLDFMSPLYKKWTGIDGISELWSDAIHPDDLPSMLANIDHSLATKEDLDDLHRLRFATGEYRWVRTRATARLDEHGDVIRWYGYVQDIHDEREATLRLQESEAHYRHTIENSPIASWSATPEGVLDFMSPQYEKWTGVTGLNETWLATLHPDDVPAMLQAIEEGLKTNTGLDIHNRIRFRDGSYRWVHTQASARFDDLGNVVRWYGSTEDVHEEREAALRLKESEHRFRLIADSAPVPMWVTGLDRVRSFVNSAYMEFLGETDYERARTFDWVSIIHPDDKGQLIAASLAGEATLQPFSLEARYRRHDGEYRWLKSRSQPRWGPSGEPDGFHGVATDITEAKEAEIALRSINDTLEQRVHERTTELEETHRRLLSEITERQIAQAALTQAQKMESVGQLTGGIAHDFNNMLQIMIGNLELIKMMTARVDDVKVSDKISRFVAQAMDGATKAATLTAQLLAFSRKTRLKVEKICANDIVPNVVDMMTRSIGRNIEIEADLDSDLWLCLSDKAQLEVALVNLALNARDAMPDGGKITIKTANRTIRDRKLFPASRYVSVSVTDNGTGMPKEVVDRVFEPFFTTKSVGKGTGLGLSMVYGFCQQANGRVEVHSKVGEGTTVEMLFPFTRHSRSMQDNEHLLDEQPAKGPATVLVVDDEPAVRELAVNLLDSLGYNALQASSGDEALQTIQGGVVVDLVFSDVVMPGVLDGFALASALKKLHPDLPVILATGHAEVLLNGSIPDDLRNLKILGKPYRTADLSQCVANVLERSAKAA